MEYSAKKMWELSPQDIFCGTQDIARIENTLLAIGQYKSALTRAFVAKKLNDRAEIKYMTLLDYYQRVEHRVMYFSMHEFGGKKFELVIDTDLYRHGRIASSPEEFHDDMIIGLNKLVRNFYNIENHRKTGFCEHAPHPGNTLNSIENFLASYLNSEMT